MGRQLDLMHAPPTAHELAADVRAVREAFAAEGAEGGWGALTVDDRGWRLTVDLDEAPRYGAVYVRAAGPRFDAMRAARRLLFALEQADVLPRISSRRPRSRRSR